MAILPPNNDLREPLARSVNTFEKMQAASDGYFREMLPRYELDLQKLRQKCDLIQEDLSCGLSAPLQAVYEKCPGSQWLESVCATQPGKKGRRGKRGKRGRRVSTCRTQAKADGATCGVNQICQSGVCAQTCSASTVCAAGQTCCGGVCADTQTSANSAGPGGVWQKQVYADEPPFGEIHRRDRQTVATLQEAHAFKRGRGA